MMNGWPDGGMGGMPFFVMPLMLGLYFLPTFIAAFSKHSRTGWIFGLNLFLGWTLIGWTVALIWSLIRQR